MYMLLVETNEVIISAHQVMLEAKT